MTMTLGQLRGEIVNENRQLTPDAQRVFNDAFSRIFGAIDKQNALIADFIAAKTKIEGRTEGIGTTVGNLTSTGQVNSTDNVIDGTGSPLTGGKRGFVGFDGNSRIANSFRNNQLNVTAIPGSSATLSNDGVSTAITITSYSNQYGAGLVANNLGSVDPGSFGKWYVYYDDPTYAGGAVTYSFSADPLAQGANDGRQLVGTITTVAGTPFTGGGNTGGTGGKGGGHGYQLA